ncbi:biotin-dependent carboxyltransferase family protein [Achromobacter sp. F4_2707]|uniref:5-oxoprolinase subunit C family protein n=1 Tax=Achromobacter sp. F4_2707 TaxID=3114286 RepID=UPI0039C61909
MSITVIRPGLASTFQDCGRHGHQHLGVPVGGAMDLRAHQLANLIAGNEHDHATLEITLMGPTLRFDAPTCIALTGADLSPTVNGLTVPLGRPLIMHAGDILSFGERRNGVRCYLAWHGGIALPSLLGSQSTYLRGALGGFQGRTLRKEDVLPLNLSLRANTLETLEESLDRMSIYLPSTLANNPRTHLRVMRGPHTELFTQEAVHALFNSPYVITNESDRMGFRLQGQALPVRENRQLLSEGATFGSIQVPADGLPIVLMADRQSIGGYPKIGHVATVDLPQLAQCMPGEAVRFEEISLAQAQQLDNLREQALGRLRTSLAGLRELIARCVANPAP